MLALFNTSIIKRIYTNLISLCVHICIFPEEMQSPL